MIDLKHCIFLHCGLWDSIPHHKNDNIVTCKQVFTLKYHPYGTMTHHRAWFMARGLTLAHEIDYTKTFSLVVPMNFIQILLYLIVNQDCSLHKLEIFNAFINADLAKQVFMEQPLGYFALEYQPLWSNLGLPSSQCYWQSMKAVIENTCPRVKNKAQTPL